MQFSLPFISKNNKEEVYFGLFLKEEEAIGFVLERRGHNLEITAEERISFVNGWDNIVECVDELLFSLEQKSKKHLEKIIFFVYSHLIDQNTKDIKKSYLTVFKNILKHLELKPLGYIECYEAVANYYEKKDQSPLTAVLIELDKSNVGVFVYKGGHKTFAKTVGRTQNIIDDLESVFIDVKGDMLLPSRIILYDSYDLDSESTTILSHRWNTELFVQYPRVEIVKPTDLHKGLVIVFEDQIKNSNYYVEEKEIIQGKKEVMGFTIGEEVEAKENNAEREDFNEISESVIIKEQHASFFSKLKIKISQIKFPTRLSSGHIIIVTGIALILIALGLTEYFFHKVQLTVLFPSHTLSKTIEENLTIGEKSDKGTEIKSFTFSQDYNEKKATTGKRDVGEKAKGEVTINSFDNKDRVFSKGTILEVNNIKFVLDDEIKVASYSEKIINDSTARLPGTNKDKATAVEIGTEGNIAKGQKLKIADLSLTDFFAVSNTAFTGGSKKQIRTVSKQDVEDIKKRILEKSKQEANSKIKTELQNNNILLDSLTNTTLDNIQISKEIGEETEQVSTKATSNTTYYTLSKKEVQNMLKDSFKGEVPSGFHLTDDQISFEVKDVEQNENKISMKITAKAAALKDVEKDDIIHNVKGMNIKDVEKILKEKFQASGYEVKAKTSIFFLKEWIPFFEKNINLVISSI
ncbi:MAG: hypothetical protein HYW86_02405 [Candidatus Roizmanbacteria bacterium]|nr:MAG: hypothetical protein HYW86_02405 [Candidatus Roizmanbacteria bacterium]